MKGSNDYILWVDNVIKTFEGIHALEHVSFGVKKGHIKALIGPNGAGKTTMLNAISGLLPPDSGSVYLNNQQIAGLTPDRIALLGLSRTFQLVRLFTINNATVLDNVLLGAHKHLNPSIFEAMFYRGRMKRKENEAKERALNLLKFVGLEGAEDALPGTLSFGNQRLLELARSLMTEPKLLLLDEPASGLNDAEVESFIKLLLAIRDKGITILIVEHNMKVVMKIADDIIVLDFGKKLAEGTPEEISKNQQVVEAYLGTQKNSCKVEK
ncbi:MAG TPA: ABC transporter ATP-binding protein [Syntrophorhabdaceae bacterium]|nr:ABC transporter ATP-binding protein [Syntrophorhabdaceae bacterium]HOL06437.1 ABC transporter ATP-binding protein [Syntrophorhabdaceae bacterium]HPP42752.1 ABC transporter ATP-binding protein [Syntrophorhabdaceae bacterium]